MTVDVPLLIGTRNTTRYLYLPCTATFTFIEQAPPSKGAFGLPSGIIFLALGISKSDSQLLVNSGKRGSQLFSYPSS